MRIIGALIMLLCVCASASADLKVTRKAGAGGRESQSTVYIKGARERTEMPMITTIRQCDLKRTIQLNERARKYVIVPDDEGGAATNTPAPSTPAAAQGPKQPRRGAVVTYTVNINDTGERKQMFGYNARHIKTTTVMDAPAEACNPGHMEMESDGWYIDFAAAGPACDVDRPVPPTMRGPRPDCQDQVRFRTTGTGRLGFPVAVTTRFKMAGAQGEGGEEDAQASAMMSNAMTSTLEVTDISTVTLDPSLFDVPAGYTQAASMQELYSSGMGIMSGAGGMPSGAQPPSGDGQGMGATPGPAATAARPKQPGMIRVGVAAINNRAGGAVSLGALRERLVGSISDSNVEAVALEASDPAAADAEAKAKECDFVLYTDLSALKQSAASKVGGMFGRVAGVGGLEKFESRVDFRLVATGGSAPSLESNATAKEEGADASVGAALEREAKAVTAAARKKK